MTKPSFISNLQVSVTSVSIAKINKRMIIAVHLLFFRTYLQQNWGPQYIEGMQCWAGKEVQCAIFYSLLYLLVATANLRVLK